MSDQSYVAPSDNAAPAVTNVINAVPGEVHALEALISPAVKESKAGYKTTEFWIAVATAVLLNVNAIPLPDKFQGWATAGLAAVYALSRGIAKSGVPVVAEDAS